MNKNYTIFLISEIAMEAVTTINNFVNSGWYMVDYTHNRIVLEKQFEFEGNEEALKFYVEHVSGLVSAVYVGTNAIYLDDKGWLGE